MYLVRGWGLGVGCHTEFEEAGEKKRKVGKQGKIYQIVTFISNFGVGGGDGDAG